MSKGELMILNNDYMVLRYMKFAWLLLDGVSFVLGKWLNVREG